MKDSIQWVKVSVVSGVLLAGFMSKCAPSPDAQLKVFRALVGRYAIERRQWVEIGMWFGHLADMDGIPVLQEQFFQPAGDNGFYLDARHMNVQWQGDYERFAGQCELWIQKMLDNRGLFMRGAAGDANGLLIPSDREREVVNKAFGAWCRKIAICDIQNLDECQ